jgi:hypothetical protein
MNPNLQRLAEETKDPSLKAEKFKPLGADLCFLVDTSGSMTAYHDMVKQGVRECIETLNSDDRQHEFAAVNYAGQTLFSGWQPAYSIKKVLETADIFQGDMSRFNDSVLDKLLQHRKFSVLVATDGMVMPGIDFPKILERIVKAGNDVNVLLFGDNGLEVPDYGDYIIHRITDHNEIAKQMKNYAKYLKTIKSEQK